MTSQDRYLELFATESREHLEEIARALVALESHPDDPEPLEAVFRSAHTLKGMAAAMGYEAISRLAHGMESTLDAVRDGRRAVDASLIDLLLHGADLLEEMVETAVVGEEGPDPQAAIEALAGAEAGGGATGSAPLDAGAPEAAARPGRRESSSVFAGAGTNRVRVDIRRLDALMNLIGELVIVRSRLHSIAADLGSEPLLDAMDRATRLITQMQTEVMESRLVPVWQVFDRFPRAVRDTARQLGKEVELAISGKELELDRSLLDVIADPLIHLLRNAVDHGIESPTEREKAGKARAGRIELSAQRERSRVLIVVRDDGRGVDREAVLERGRALGLVGPDDDLGDAEIFRLLARPGFTTRGEVTMTSGRGVGLDVVEASVRRCGGSIEFRSEPGAGTTVVLELPLTLAIVRALLVEVGGREYALPTTYARESFEVEDDVVEQAHGREWVSWRGELVPLMRLQRLFEEEVQGRRGADPLRLIAIEAGGERLAVSVDRLIGEREVVVKSFDLPRGALPVFSGATVQPDGRPALILDVGSLS